MIDNCCMIVWCGYQIVSPFFSLLMTRCFLTFSIVFPNTDLFIKLKKYFSQSYFSFFLVLHSYSYYDFFFKTNTWFDACIRFLMSIIYHFLISQVRYKLFDFINFVYSGKNGKSLWRSCKCSGYWTSTSRKYPSLLFYYNFSKNLN